MSILTPVFLGFLFSNRDKQFQKSIYSASLNFEHCSGSNVRKQITATDKTDEIRKANTVCAYGNKYELPTNLPRYLFRF